jgi:O-methyltransferase involved in polyketide biosynthesis
MGMLPDMILLAEGYLQNLPSIWLLEGLLMYLSVEEVHRLLKTVSELSTTGSWIGLDLINELAKEDPIDKEFKGYFTSGFDNPEELLASYGWQAEVFQPGDEGANFGRHPHKFPPRNVGNIQRAFFIKAKKISA